jgi:hypothetical protein
MKFHVKVDNEIKYCRMYSTLFCYFFITLYHISNSDTVVSYCIINAINTLPSSCLELEIGGGNTVVNGV